MKRIAFVFLTGLIFLNCLFSQVNQHGIFFITKNLLTDIHELEMEKQREILENRFLEWKGKNPQIDDILILGVKI